MKLQEVQAELLLPEAQLVTSFGLNNKLDQRVHRVAQAILDKRVGVAYDLGGVFEVPQLEDIRPHSGFQRMQGILKLQGLERFENAHPIIGDPNFSFSPITISYDGQDALLRAVSTIHDSDKDSLLNLHEDLGAPSLEASIEMDQGLADVMPFEEAASISDYINNPEDDGLIAHYQETLAKNVAVTQGIIDAIRRNRTL